MLLLLLKEKGAYMNIKLFVATPMYGGMCHGHYAKSISSLFALCTKNGIPIHLETVLNESLIQRARNSCVDAFLQSDFSHFLFIDADIGFNSKDVLTMLAMLLKDKEQKYDVLAAVYPKKEINWDRIKQKKSFSKPAKELAKLGNEFTFNPISQGSITFEGGVAAEVSDAGTGFMMIPRKTFENFIKAYPEQSYRPYSSFSPSGDPSKIVRAFFDSKIDPESKLYLAEDYMFCQYVRKMGGKIWILPWISLSHAGNYSHTGSLTESASLFSV